MKKKKITQVFESAKIFIKDNFIYYYSLILNGKIIYFILEFRGNGD